MNKLSASQDIKRGKRLEEFLGIRFPKRSWLSRSQELGVHNSTVIGWRQGREISNYGIARLLDLGCDILWLLTGQRNTKQSPPPPLDKESMTIKELLAVKAELLEQVKHVDELIAKKAES